MTYFKNKSFWFWGFIILVLINVSVLGSTAFVINKMHKHPEYKAFHHKFKGEKRSKRINKKEKGLYGEMSLDEAQRKQIEQTRREHNQKVKNLKAEIKKNQQLLFEELTKEFPDSNIVQNYKKEDARLHLEIMEESIVFIGKMKKDLTDEQQQMLKKHILKRFNRNINTQKK